MIQVDRRFLAWVVSVGIGCLGIVIAVRALWPGMVQSGGGFGAASLAFPSVISSPFLIGNIVLSVIARRRGGRLASVGSRCLWTLGILVVVSLAVSLTPPAVFQSLNSVFMIVLLLVLAMSVSLPAQLIILALLTFTLIGSSRTPRAAGDTR
jgi:hypothetical protein